MTTLIVIVLGVLVILMIVAFEVYKKGKQALVREKKEAYDKAIKEGDKQKAVIAGRAYYSELRGGSLSIYDEQAIANDISTI